MVEVVKAEPLLKVLGYNLPKSFKPTATRTIALEGKGFKKESGKQDHLISEAMVDDIRWTVFQGLGSRPRVADDAGVSQAYVSNLISTRVGLKRSELLDEVHDECRFGDFVYGMSLPAFGYLNKIGMNILKSYPCRIERTSYRSNTEQYLFWLDEGKYALVIENWKLLEETKDGLMSCHFNPEAYMNGEVIANFIRAEDLTVHLRHNNLEFVTYDPAKVDKAIPAGNCTNIWTTTRGLFINLKTRMVSNLKTVRNPEAPVNKFDVDGFKSVSWTIYDNKRTAFSEKDFLRYSLIDKLLLIMKHNQRGKEVRKVNRTAGAGVLEVWTGVPKPADATLHFVDGNRFNLTIRNLRWKF